MITARRWQGLEAVVDIDQGSWTTSSFTEEIQSRVYEPRTGRSPFNSQQRRQFLDQPRASIETHVGENTKGADVSVLSLVRNNLFGSKKGLIIEYVLQLVSEKSIFRQNIGQRSSAASYAGRRYNYRCYSCSRSLLRTSLRFRLRLSRFIFLDFASPIVCAVIVDGAASLASIDFGSVLRSVYPTLDLRLSCSIWFISFR